MIPASSSPPDDTNSTRESSSHSHSSSSPRSSTSSRRRKPKPRSLKRRRRYHGSRAVPRSRRTRKRRIEFDDDDDPYSGSGGSGGSSLSTPVGSPPDFVVTTDSASPSCPSPGVIGSYDEIHGRIESISFEDMQREDEEALAIEQQKLREKEKEDSSGSGSGLETETETETETVGDADEEPKQPRDDDGVVDERVGVTDDDDADAAAAADESLSGIGVPVPPVPSIPPPLPPGLPPPLPPLPPAPKRALPTIPQRRPMPLPVPVPVPVPASLSVAEPKPSDESIESAESAESAESSERGVASSVSVSVSVVSEDEDQDIATAGSGQPEPELEPESESALELVETTRVESELELESESESATETEVVRKEEEDSHKDLESESETVDVAADVKVEVVVEGAVLKESKIASDGEGESDGERESPESQDPVSPGEFSVDDESLLALRNESVLSDAADVPQETDATSVEEIPVSGTEVQQGGGGDTLTTKDEGNQVTAAGASDAVFVDDVDPEASPSVEVAESPDLVPRTEIDVLNQEFEKEFADLHEVFSKRLQSSQNEVDVLKAKLLESEIERSSFRKDSSRFESRVGELEKLYEASEKSLVAMRTEMSKLREEKENSEEDALIQVAEAQAEAALVRRLSQESEERLKSSFADGMSEAQFKFHAQKLALEKEIGALKGELARAQEESARSTTTASDDDHSGSTEGYQGQASSGETSSSESSDDGEDSIFGLRRRVDVLEAQLEDKNDRIRALTQSLHRTKMETDQKLAEKDMHAGALEKRVESIREQYFHYALLCLKLQNPQSSFNIPSIVNRALTERIDEGTWRVWIQQQPELGQIFGASKRRRRSRRRN